MADLNSRSPPGILPVGYPVFLPVNQDLVENEQDHYLQTNASKPVTASTPVGPPLRQSPASALPPILSETHPVDDNRKSNNFYHEDTNL